MRKWWQVLQQFWGTAIRRLLASAAAKEFCTDWRIAAIIFTLFVVVVAATRFVSLGSILAATAFAVCFLVFYWGDWLVCVLAVAAAAFVVFRHRGNLVRLVKGTESKLSFHKKK